MQSRLFSVTIDQVVFEYFLGNNVVYIEKPFLGTLHISTPSDFRLSGVLPRVFDTELTHHAMRKLIAHIQGRPTA